MPVNPHGNMERTNHQNTEAEPGWRRRRGAAHTTKVKKLENFRKKCPFQSPIFLVYTDRQKIMFFHWFLNVFWGRRHIFWGHFSARHRYHPSKNVDFLLVFQCFLKNRIGKRHKTNATGRCPENIVLAELEM